MLGSVFMGLNPCHRAQEYARSLIRWLRGQRCFGEPNRYNAHCPHSVFEWFPNPTRPLAVPDRYEARVEVDDAHLWRRLVVTGEAGRWLSVRPS